MASERDLSRLVTAVSGQSKATTERWNGTLLEYLRDKAPEDPSFGSNAAGHLVRAIQASGVTPVETADNPRLCRLFGDSGYTRYELFDDFYGIETEIETVVNFLTAAAQGGQYARQALWFIGRAGSGKSSLAERLAAGLERSGITFFAVKGCPLHEHPLALVPNFVKEEAGFPSEGGPCPHCSDIITQKQGNYWDVEIEECSFSEAGRSGIGRMTTNGRGDLVAMIGSVEPANGHGGHAAGLRLNGVFHRGGRGIVEIGEMRETDDDIVRLLLGATEERFIPDPTRTGRIGIDSVIIIHSHGSDWEAFKSKHKGKGILDRITPVKVRYNLRFDQAVQILRKLLRRGRIKYQEVPGVFAGLGRFMVGTRLKAGLSEDEQEERIRIHNGEVIVGKQTPTAFELREKDPDEGFDSGVSDRFAVAAVEEALLKGEILFWWKLADALRARIKRDTVFAPDEKKRYETLLERATKTYHAHLVDDLRRATVGEFDTEFNRLFLLYLKHADWFVVPPTRRDHEAKEVPVADIGFLRAVEAEIGLVDQKAEDWRRAKAPKFFQLTRRGGEVTPDADPELAEAVRKYLQNKVRDACRTALDPSANDEKDRIRGREVRERLVVMGYPRDSVEQIITYVLRQKLLA